MSDRRGAIESPATFAAWHFPWPTFEVSWDPAGPLVVDMQNYGRNRRAGLREMVARLHPDLDEVKS